MKRIFAVPPRRHALMLLSAAALLFVPAVIIGGEGYDLLCQALWIKHFSAQFWHGDLYPRWLQDMYVGRGSPAFFYYPPLSYFIMAFLAFLSPLLPYQYAVLIAGALLAACVAAATFYYWMKAETQSETAALLGSLLYVTAPYYVAFNFYFSPGPGTLWVFAWLPLLLLFSKRLAQGGARDIAPFALALCLLILTNLPQTLIWGPCALLYGVVHLRRESFVRQGLRFIPALALAFGLAAFFLLPAVEYMPYTIMKRLWTDTSSNYHSYFLKPGFGDIYAGSYTAAWFIMAALVAFYAAFGARRSRTALFFIGVSAAALCMMLPVSVAVWDRIPILNILQFPMRFFIVPTLGLAVLASLAMPRLKGFACALLLAYLGVAFYTAYGNRGLADGIETQYRLGIEQYSHYMTSYDIVPRYYGADGLRDVLSHPEPVGVVSGSAETQVVEWQPRHIALDYTAPVRSILRVRQFYFPGFVARLNGAFLRYGREGASGEILLDVPPGSGRITLDLEPLGPEKWGGWISLIALGMLAALYFSCAKSGGGRSVSDD